MLDNLNVNVSSLKLVEEELNTTIQQTAGYFEGFLLERTKTAHLEKCFAGIAQIRGTIKLLEVPGALQLTDEMHTFIGRMLEDENAINDHNLSVLSSAFISLPCYLEHTADREYALPILVSPYINELRAARFVDLVPESHSAGLNVDLELSPTLNEVDEGVEDFDALVRRLRHMYLVGLLGVIREENIDAHIRLLLRAVTRLQSVSGNHKLAELWWLTAALLDGFEQQALAFTLFRKRVLSSIDKYIKAVVYGGEQALDTEVPKVLKKELLFLVAIADAEGERSEAVRQLYDLPSPAYTDKAIVKERDLMQGPNAATIHSMVTVLKEELTVAKEVLEIAAQDVSGSPDFLPLLEILQKIADILSVVGVRATGNFLREQIEKIEQWKNASDEIDQQDLLDVADAMLYVESTLTGLDRLDLSEDDLKEASELVKQQVIAKSHLAEAELIVIQEAQSGISLAKRAISSFIESQYDTVHIANVSVTLNSVRGGLVLLNLNRAAAILSSCMRFVENTLNEGFSDEGISELLETLADALIALEYYLSEVESHSDADQKVLEVAEESLASLGYPVDAQ